MHRLLLLGVSSVAALVLSGTAAAWSWPADGDVLRTFALGGDAYAAGQHRGIDVAGPDGSSIRAPASGTVSFAGSLPTYGRSLTLLTPDGYAVTLVHLGSIEVGKGDTVDEGSPVATMGSSGEPEHAVPSVHMGVRVASQEEGYVDPLGLLPPRGTPRTSAPESPSPVATTAPAPTPAPATSPTPTAPATPPAATQAGAAPPAAAPPSPVGTSAPESPASPAPVVSAASALGGGTSPAPSPVLSASAASATSARSGSVAAGPESISSGAAPASEATESSAPAAEHAGALVVSSPPRGRSDGPAPAPVSGRVKPVVEEPLDGRPAARVVVLSGGGRVHGRIAAAPAADGPAAPRVVHTDGAAPARPGAALGNGSPRHGRESGVAGLPRAALAEDGAIPTPSYAGAPPAAGPAVPSSRTTTVDAASARVSRPSTTTLATMALIALLGLGMATKAVRRIAGDGAVLRHHADLLRQLHAAHRARVHDRRSGRLRAPSAATRP